MPPEVTAADVRAWSLAHCDAYWDKLRPLSPAQRRWRKAEREFRTARAADGFLPDADNPIIARFRSGEWERRQRQNMKNMLHNQARLARLKREGYSFDAEHRLVAPALIRIHAPERRENVARPRERRARRASTSSRASPDSDPEPPLRVIPLATFRRVLRHSLRAS